MLRQLALLLSQRAVVQGPRSRIPPNPGRLFERAHFRQLSALSWGSGEGDCAPPSVCQPDVSNIAVALRPREEEKETRSEGAALVLNAYSAAQIAGTRAFQTTVQTWSSRHGPQQLPESADCAVSKVGSSFGFWSPSHWRSPSFFSGFSDSQQRSVSNSALLSTPPLNLEHEKATRPPTPKRAPQAVPTFPAYPPLHSSPSFPNHNSTKTPPKSSALRSGVLDGPPTATSYWLKQISAPWLWPYIQLGRYDKPIGTWLLLWPCFWSIALAAPPGAFPDPVLMALFGAGAIVMRGAGCTVNDMWDRDIDSKVLRTRDRPLASKQVSPRQAFLFLAAQSTVGLGILLQLNDYSKVLGASSLFLVATYPLMKRVTSWPQAYLGLTFNWGALLGWSAVKGSLFLPAVAPLYAAGICWTLVYDTIYAHQDKEDDRLVGVKSTALRFGAATPQWLTGFGAATLAGLATAGALVGLEWPFYAGLTVAGAHLTWQIATLKMNDRANCSTKFVSNKWFGAIVFASIVAGKLVAG